MLTRDQELLLVSLVEALRLVPRDERHPFRIFRPMGQGTCWIMHKGFSGGHSDAYQGDVDALLRAGLIAVAAQGRAGYAFDITAEGLEHAETLETESDEAVTRVEDSIRNHLLAPDGFRKQFPEAARKWEEAESQLWPAKTDSEFTTIGHICREAMIAFASTLVERHKPDDAPSDPAKTVARLQAVVKKAKRSATAGALLDALIVYWGTVSDLVQRQEHGATKEGQALTQEDARRVVFQTCNLFYELHRSL